MVSPYKVREKRQLVSTPDGSGIFTSNCETFVLTGGLNGSASLEQPPYEARVTSGLTGLAAYYQGVRNDRTTGLAEWPSLVHPQYRGFSRKAQINSLDGIKSVHRGRFLGTRVVALEQRKDGQNAEANDRENLERIEVCPGAGLRLHRQVHPPQSLMARVGCAHARMEQIIGESGELLTQGGVVSVQMHTKGVLMYLRPSLGQSRHH